MVYCLLDHLDEDVDLVLLDFVPNDPPLDVLIHNKVVLGMEMLLRRLLTLPKKPALVMVANSSPAVRLYTRTTAFLQGAIAAYYDVPVVSPRTALTRLVTVDPTEGWEPDHVYVDNHPGSSGHKAIADTLVHFLQDTLLDLMHRPMTRAEIEARDKPLPKPMFPGNLPPASAVCLIAGRLQSLIRTLDGFEWKEESLTHNRHKWGYVSEIPGSAMELEVDTVRPQLLPRGAPIPILLEYLASYSPMGVARLECVAHCSCPAREVDAHIDDHWSQNYMAALVVSQHQRCRIRVTLLNKTRSGGWKFKVIGLVLVEPAAGTAFQTKGWLLDNDT